MRVMLLVPTIGGCTYEYHHPEELRRSSGMYPSERKDSNTFGL